MTRERLDADARRKQFESAAISLVNELGFKAVTTDLIAQRAGVSKGLLWRYYSNLNELMQRSAERAFRELEQTVAGRVDLTQPVPTLLRETVRQASRLPQSHYNELLAIQRIANNLEAIDAVQTVAGTDAYGKLYLNQAAIFARGQAEGSIRADLNPQLLARIYQGGVDAMIDQLMHDPKLDASAYAEYLSSVLLNGITIK